MMRCSHLTRHRLGEEGRVKIVPFSFLELVLNRWCDRYENCHTFEANNLTPSRKMNPRAAGGQFLPPFYASHLYVSNAGLTA